MAFSLINKKSINWFWKKIKELINLHGTFMQKARDDYFIYGTG